MKWRLRATAVLGLALVSLVLAPTASSTSGTLVITANTTLTEDHFGHIVIEADNVTLDCAGHAVRAPDEPGFSGAIDVQAGRTGVTVKRCRVVGSTVNGIYAGDVSNSRYVENVFERNANHGIHIDGGTGNEVVRNTSRDNGALGIVFTAVSDSRIVGNLVESNANWAGVALFAESRGIYVAFNLARANAFGFLVESGSSGNRFLGNAAHENVLQGFALTGVSQNVLAANVSNDNGWEGYLLVDADDNALTGNLANNNGEHETNTFAGFGLVEGSDGNELRANAAFGNADEGFILEASSSNTLSRNLSNRNGQVGFEARLGSSFNTFERNSARQNAVLDAFDDQTGPGNVWVNNNFGTTAGI